MKCDVINRLKVRRGTELPHAKLNEDDIRLIRQSVIERERLRAEANQLSNKSLAEKMGVHIRTIEKAVQYHTWVHV